MLSRILIHLQYFKVLDQILDDFAELIRAHYDITDFADPSSATDVCPDPQLYAYY